MATSFQSPGIVLVGAGVMSATPAVMLKELDPALNITIFEVLEIRAQESSNASIFPGHKSSIPNSLITDAALTRQLRADTAAILHL